MIFDPENPKQPIVCHRASIFTVQELKIRFLWRKQADKVILWLTDNNIRFEFSIISPGDSYNPTEYELNIKELPWAHNLKRLAKVLEKSDFKMD